MEDVLSFVQAHKPSFELAQALSSVVNLFAWLLALVLVVIALRQNRIAGNEAARLTNFLVSVQM